MKNLTKYLPLLGLCALLLFSCKKEKLQKDYAFSAYVNGKLWVPEGSPGYFRSNLSIMYYPDTDGGVLEITAYRKTDDTDDRMLLYMSHLDHEGVYSLDDPETGTATFWGNCIYDRDPDVYREGTLEITKLDIKDGGSLRGRFEFTLAKPGCDTLRVTRGLFQ